MRSIFRTARVRAELLLNWYSNHAQRRPVLVGSMTLGTLAACGDLTAQTLEQRNKQVFSFDTTRFASLVTYAAIYNGPVNTRLYAGYVKLFGDGTLRAAIKGTALDQLVYMPFMAIPISFLFKDTITHKGMDLSRVRENLQLRWLSSVTGCWTVFVPLELINLYFVPLRYRVAMSGIMSFCWMTVLSNRQSAKLEDTLADAAPADAAPADAAPAASSKRKAADAAESKKEL